MIGGANMNLFIYPFEREFTWHYYDCVDCPYSPSEFITCMWYCIFSNACHTALEMGWF